MLHHQARKRPHYNEEDIKAQLSQVHLIEFDSSNAQDESLEQLGPILKNINESQQERDYIKALDAFISEKDSELEEQCKYNYQVGIYTNREANLSWSL